MKRSLWTAVLAAGVLLAAGCSSNSAGTGSAASTAAASSTASSAAVSADLMSSGSMSSEPMMSDSSSVGSESSSAASGAGGSGGASASVTPAQLDAQTVAWFTTLCEGVAPIGKLSNLNTSGQDAATAQKTGVDALKKFGAVLSDTSAKLKSAPPPTFAGGTDFADQMASGLEASGPQLAAVAQSFGAINPKDTAALKQAVTGLPDQLQQAVAPLKKLTELPADVSAAAQQIPACASLNG